MAYADGPVVLKAMAFYLAEMRSNHVSEGGANVRMRVDDVKSSSCDEGKESNSYGAGYQPDSIPQESWARNCWYFVESDLVQPDSFNGMCKNSDLMILTKPINQACDDPRRPCPVTNIGRNERDSQSQLPLLFEHDMEKAISLRHARYVRMCRPFFDNILSVIEES